MGYSYFEDVEIGEVRQLPAREIGKDEVLDFAKRFDAQPFHVDELAAQRSMFGGLIASGWHTGAIVMRMMMDARSGTNEAMIGSPGNDGLYWLKPVRPGDTLSGTITTTDKKLSQSKPWLGAVFSRVEVQNQHGEDVYLMEGRGLVLCRPVAGKAPPEHTPGKAQQSAANADFDWSRALDPMNRPRIHFEDFEAGQVWDLGAETVSRNEIIEFASKFDPQPFHLDEAAAKATHFGGLVASGWHTAATFMGLFARNMLSNTDSLGSPGMKSLRWRKALRPGDTVRGRIEIKTKKQSASKPWMGFVDIDYYLTNQHGEDILYMDGTGMYGSREHKREVA